MSTTVLGVDVSSHQHPNRTDLLTWIGEGCQVLVIHTYTFAERAALAESTRQWVALARETGLWRQPYVWMFGGVDPVEQVRSALELWRDCGETPTILWLDLETYGSPVTDNGPTVDQIIAAVQECQRQGVNAGIYSAAWWLVGHLKGDPGQLAGLPYWGAQYDGVKTVESLHVPYGLRAVGHQYQGSPLDWSAWDLEALAELGQGFAPPIPADPCATMKTALRAELAVLAGVRERLEALL